MAGTPSIPPASKLSPNWGLKIGVLTPATNVTVEEELWSMRVRGATQATARIVIDTVDWTAPDGIEKFVKNVNERVPETATRMMQANPDVLMLGISSSNLWGGLKSNEELKAAIRTQTGREMLTPVDAVVRIAKLYDVHKIGVVTPYPEAADAKIVEFFAEFGVEVIAQKGLRLTSPGAIGEVSEDTLRKALAEVCVPGVEGLFQLGTDLKMAQVAAQAEGWLGKPTISVNTATWWHTLRSSGIKAQIEGWGDLLENH
jgi:maleate isomerase